MQVRLWIAAILVVTTSAPGLAQLSAQPLTPYPLPASVLRTVQELAAQSDVLVLGEIHGTQEVPSVAAALLAPLAKLGFQALALEVPAEQRAALTAWASGETTKVPSFFAHPWEDGRGSAEALSLIRTALSPPYRWKLICFDGKIAELNLAADESAQGDSASLSEQDRTVALSMRRDALMAANLTDQLQQLAPQAKVLAICGGLHARTANHRAPGDPFAAMWPSFAAVLKNDHAAGRVRSVNVAAYSGGFFAMIAPADGGPPRGGVHAIRAQCKLDEAEAHLTPAGDWDLELGLPHATPATYLATPSGPVPPMSNKVDGESRARGAVQSAAPCHSGNRLRCRRRTCRG